MSEFSTFEFQEISISKPEDAKDTLLNVAASGYSVKFDYTRFSEYVVLRDRLLRFPTDKVYVRAVDALMVQVLYEEQKTLGSPLTVAQVEDCSIYGTLDTEPMDEHWKQVCMKLYDLKFHDLCYTSVSTAENKDAALFAFAEKLLGDAGIVPTNQLHELASWYTDFTDGMLGTEFEIFGRRSSRVKDENKLLEPFVFMAIIYDHILKTSGLGENAYILATVMIQAGYGIGMVNIPEILLTSEDHLQMKNGKMSVDDLARLFLIRAIDSLKFLLSRINRD